MIGFVFMERRLESIVQISAGIGCPVPRIPAEATPLADHVSATRILCGALVFPTIATIVGKLMFSSVNSNLQRTILVSNTLVFHCWSFRMDDVVPP